MQVIACKCVKQYKCKFTLKCSTSESNANDLIQMQKPPIILGVHIDNFNCFFCHKVITITMTIIMTHSRTHNLHISVKYKNI